jgi:uncharacterized glyoxalase superfamily protein PhnB
MNAINIAPVFCVNDMRQMIDYMVERLGFRVQQTAGEGPNWASMFRDRIEIMLLAGRHPEPAQDWAAYVYIQDADALYAEFEKRGADLVGPPVNRIYNNREFEVRLPDGRRLAFGATILV